MPTELHQPLSYLITSGETTPATSPQSEEFARLLALVRAAVAARVSLLQLREKQLRPRVLYELTVRAAEITSGSRTRLLVNDRADIARAAGADGVHLAAQSIPAVIIRQSFGSDFLIGVSTHTPAEARAAREDCADFAVFGPVFDTPSKRAFGPPLGLASLRAAAHALAPFPLIAIGGITLENAAEVLRAGASGVAAIRLFGDAEGLEQVVEKLGRGRQ
ncbi:MAG: thiamine phosphate synthase [Acidobacteria bacterium]|nr:thiamine phosphate synthase [Acidobacteriota bacterium]